MKKLPAKEDILRVYSYNPDTGIFTSLRKSIRYRVGRKVRPTLKGYVCLTINGGSYAAHRIAMVLMGVDPGQNQIDHINHNKSDNRIKNLRVVTHLVNSRNMPLAKNSKTGFTGVLWRSCAGRFRSHIMINNKEVHLGYSKTLIDAVILRMKANIKYGFHTNHGML